MDANSLVLNIGVSDSDGDFLIYGFGPTTGSGDSPGGCHRGLKQNALLRLPVYHKHDTTVTMSVKGPVSGYICHGKPVQQTVRVLVGETELACFSPNPKQWEDVAFVIPAALCDSDSVPVRLLCAEFCEGGGHPGSLYLAEVRISGVSLASSGRPCVSLGENVYFGDIHKHSTMSPCGCPKPFAPERNAGTPEENYERYSSENDFICLTDHSETMSEDAFREALNTADRFNVPGKFSALYGYEWTSPLFGHKNVYGLDKDIPFLRTNSSDGDSPNKLFDKLGAYNALVISHHPSRVEFPAPLNIINNQMQPLVEIYSGWGSSEYYGSPLAEKVNTAPGLDVQSALLRGHRFGFVGGSDGHTLDGLSVGNHTPNNGRKWGLTGLWSDTLTRESVFNALQQRRTFATTGAKIKLRVTMNTYPMGSEIFCNQYTAETLFPLAFAIDINGTSDIRSVELLCNNQVIRTAELPLTSQFRAGFVVDPFRSTDRVGPGDKQGYMPLSLNAFVNAFSMFFYVRVTQMDGHMAWSSPIWLTCQQEV